jgi:rhamnogalacturonan endolyase
MRTQLLNILISLFLPGVATASLTDSAPVTLSHAQDHVTLSNGIVTFTVISSNGNIDALKYHSTSILESPGYLDWVGNGNHHINNGVLSVVTDPTTTKGKMAEISIASKYDGAAAGKNLSPFDVEIHYVLRQGESGLHCFVVFHHAASYPAGSIGQSRWVLRLDDKVFDTINVDDERRRQMPPSDTPNEILGPKEVSQFTQGPFKGLITQKYFFFADAGDHFVHGWTSTQQHIGCWVAYGSTESQNGGPTKQHNTAHFPRMLFKILTCGHYGSGSGLEFTAGEEWQKIFGPWELYFNADPTQDGLWNDAKKQAAELRADWPPAWMNNPLMPPKNARGSITGRIQLSDPRDSGASFKNAWVGLAAPQPDWQKQGKGYQFWVHPDPDGSFTIPDVRPGEYTLYAFTDGVMDEYHHSGVVVSAQNKLNLGTLEWTPIRYGRQLWQIGVPDRSAEEFRHGDDYREYGLWNKFPQEFPNGVNFVIGKSNERTDWNYAQVNVKQNGQWVGTTWNIQFDMPQQTVTGAAILRIAFAAAHNAKLATSVNGKDVDSFRTAADSTMIRSGIHGQYFEHDIVFDASMLHPGPNTIALTQSAGGAPMKCVMYDCLRLELDDSGPFTNGMVHLKPQPLEVQPSEESSRD